MALQMRKVSSKEVKMSRMNLTGWHTKWENQIIIVTVSLVAICLLIIFFTRLYRINSIINYENDSIDEIGRGCQVSLVGFLPKILIRPPFAIKYYDNTSSLYQVVSASWSYNPSIIRFGSNYLLAIRLTWQYNTDCGQMTTPRSLFYCNLAAAPRTNDVSLFGYFDANTCTADISDWDITSDDGLTSTVYGNIRNWYGGSGWYDTKVIAVPFLNELFDTEEHAQPVANENMIILTTQKSATLPTYNLADLDIFEPDAIILTQLLYVTAKIQPLSLRPSLKTISFAVAVYFDSGQADWTTPYVSRQVAGYLITPALMVRAQCNRRFTQLDSEFNVYQNGTSIFEAKQSMFISKVDNSSSYSHSGLDSEFRADNRLDHLLTAVRELERITAPQREVGRKTIDRKGSGDSRVNGLRHSSPGLSVSPKDSENSTRAKFSKTLRRSRRKQLQQQLRIGNKEAASSSFNKRNYETDKSQDQQTVDVSLNRARRLAAIEKSGFLGAIKDKNWSPFFYHGRMLWSYMLHPHIVCEFEQEMDELPAFFGRIEPDDCILCMRRFATNNSLLIKEHSRRYGAASLPPHLSKAAIERGSADQSPTTWHYHLNGVQAFKIKGQPFFLGVCHSISETWKQVERMQHYHRLRSYVHYFYKMEKEPPFRILAISKNIPLLKHRGVSSWFGTEEVADVAFVSGMNYDPSKSGEEILLTYGVGDLVSKVTTFSVETALELFEDSQIA